MWSSGAKTGPSGTIKDWASKWVVQHRHMLGIRSSSVGLGQAMVQHCLMLGNNGAALPELKRAIGISRSLRFLT